VGPVFAAAAAAGPPAFALASASDMTFFLAGPAARVAVVTPSNTPRIRFLPPPAVGAGFEDAAGPGAAAGAAGAAPWPFVAAGPAAADSGGSRGGAAAVLGAAAPAAVPAGPVVVVAAT
jgi:hypothetical protein